MSFYSLCFHNNFPNVIRFFRVILLYGEHALTPTACLPTYLLTAHFFKASAGEKRKKLEDLDPLSYYEAIRDMKKKRKEQRMKSHL